MSVLRDEKRQSIRSNKSSCYLITDRRVNKVATVMSHQSCELLSLRSHYYGVKKFRNSDLENGWIVEWFRLDVGDVAESTTREYNRYEWDVYYM